MEPECKTLENFALPHLFGLELDSVATEFDYYSLQGSVHNSLSVSYTCSALARFQTTDLGMDYIHDYHFDNLGGSYQERRYYNPEQAIGIAADYLTNLDEIVLIWSVHELRQRSRNCIDLEIDCDLVDNLGCNCSHNRDFLDNSGNFASGPVVQLVG